MNVHLFFCFNFSKKEASMLHIISLMMNNSEIVKLTWQSRISSVTYHKQKISSIICLILVFDCPMNGQKRRCVRISSTAFRWSKMTQSLPKKIPVLDFYVFWNRLFITISSWVESSCILDQMKLYSIPSAIKQAFQKKQKQIKSGQ